MVESSASAPIDELRALWPAVPVRVIPQASIGGRPKAPSREAARGRLGIAADRFVILLFGKWHQNKHNASAVAGVARLAGDPLLIVAGDTRGHDVRTLAQAAGLEADQLMLHDRLIKPHEVASFYAACDVVVVSHTARFLGDSGILADAVGYQRPVVGTDHGHVGRRLRNSEIGAVFPAGDAPALAAALEHVRERPPPGHAFSQPVLAPLEEVLRANLAFLSEIQQAP